MPYYREATKRQAFDLAISSNTSSLGLLYKFYFILDGASPISAQLMIDREIEFDIAVTYRLTVNMITSNLLTRDRWKSLIGIFAQASILTCGRIVSK